MNGAGRRPESMFRVKICGVTSVEDAGLAAASGADAVGVNFYRGSRRYVPPGAAALIVRAVREGGATPVGVFVDERPEVIEAICRDLGIGVVQLSGNEPPDEAARLPFRRIKAVRVATGFDAARQEYVDLYEAGIVDPTKVTRIALENAVSVASVLLLTEATMTELPEKEKAPMPEGAEM